jgi:catechol 2,3-dioxygenase-like lactoylglutathione lyase family enzyme
MTQAYVRRHPMPPHRAQQAAPLRHKGQFTPTEPPMPYNLNHVHLKTLDPGKTAQWWVTAFKFTIVSDTTRATGDRFIRCRAENGVPVNISGPLTNQKLPVSDSGVKQGLEHIGFDVDDIDAEIKRLEKLGAPLLAGPGELPDGTRYCWVEAPDHVRVELIQWPKK